MVSGDLLSYVPFATFERLTQQIANAGVQRSAVSVEPDGFRAHVPEHTHTVTSGAFRPRRLAPNDLYLSCNWIAAPTAAAAAVGHGGRPWEHGSRLTALLSNSTAAIPRFTTYDASSEILLCASERFRDPTPAAAREVQPGRADPEPGVSVLLAAHGEKGLGSHLSSHTPSCSS
ncbi:hypothetical protein CMUS01_01614 [Colletotrichum musicola]|uniref:Uncharacterized protein n=1 Tax=Colletotrichum musicola TaxID=2175873 RepID=A0A8H6NWV8_9PEZI|nr:hypothetical protein CMUS01_01614 [Colletotrichum musicola]